MTNDLTPVLFRVDKHGPFKGNVTAVFPSEPADASGNMMTCFAHVGQHSGCSYGWYCTTRPATPAEYADLKRELESAPYRYKLRVCQRITRTMNADRRAAARRPVAA